MTAKLKISTTLSLPLDFVTSTQAILAQKGKGKTYAASVEAEELLDAQQQVVIIDPTDAWWGLKSSPDGRSAGYSIPVFGGDHADLPLEVAAAEQLAAAIVSERFSAIICTANFSKGEEIRFMWAFLEKLYRLNREAMHLFVDEADIFAPQKPMGVDESRVCGAMDSLVRRGRKKGIGVTLISQRAQVINKNVLSQIDQLVALGMNHPLDLDAVEDWVKRHDTKKAGPSMIASIPSLPRGDAWVWNPTADILKRVTIRERRTFDSGATPKPGEKARTAKVLAPIDIKRLGETLSAAAIEAKANDPRELKAKIVRLEAERAQLAAGSIDVKEPKPKPAITDAQLARLEAIAKRLDARAESAQAAAGALGDVVSDLQEAARVIRVAVEPRASTPTAAPIQRWQPPRAMPQAPRPTATPPPPRFDASSRTLTAVSPPFERSKEPAPGVTGGLRRILVALAQRPGGLTNRQIGIRAGLSSQSGTFSTYISRARGEGWIADGGDLRQITAKGLSALGDYDPLPTGPALAAFWLREMGDSGAARILRALIDSYPEELTHEETGKRAALSHQSGTFSTYVSKLRGLELVAGGRQRQRLRAADELFA